MKNTLGTSVSVTLFGESHGNAVGAVLDGMAPGIIVDEDFIEHQMLLRRGGNSLSTARREPDKVKILSGVFNGKTTGTPICFIIENQDQHSKDYLKTKGFLRPSHADYTAYCKYHGFEDFRGGGHFSGRITAGIVAAGAVALSALKTKKIYIGTHMLACAGVKDTNFTPNLEEIEAVNNSDFPVLNRESAEKMKTAIIEAKRDGDSVGGILQTAVIGMPAGIGEPWFDTLESVLAHGMFAIPAVKGVEFGRGFEFASMRGSEANDSFEINDDKITTSTNNSGGINGGISNGMPIIMNTVVKPTASIYKEQKTVNMETKTNEVFRVHGRHDPAIIYRARVVADSVAALVICDMLAQRFGTDYLG